MGNDDLDKHKKIIDNLSHIEMARLWRFAPSGHIYFDGTLPLSDYFTARFLKLGFFTPSISKTIGWEQ